MGGSRGGRAAGAERVGGRRVVSLVVELNRRKLRERGIGRKGRGEERDKGQCEGTGGGGEGQ